MRAFAFVRVMSIVLTGLAAGVLLGHRMGVSMAWRELPPSSFVQLQQIIHVRFVLMMPILIFGSIGASILWAILSRRRRPFELWLVAASSIVMIAVFAMTRAVNIPINNQLMGWSIQTPPVNLVELWEPWEKVHALRTVLAIAALCLQAIALAAPISRSIASVQSREAS